MCRDIFNIQYILVGLGVGSMVAIGCDVGRGVGRDVGREVRRVVGCCVGRGVGLGVGLRVVAIDVGFGVLLSFLLPTTLILSNVTVEVES